MKNNNRDIVTSYIVQNRDAAYRLAYSYVHKQEDALDIMQEAICKALSASKSLDNPELVKPWFYRILVNTALDFLRRGKRCIYMEEDKLEAIGPYSEDKYTDIDLHNAIEQLSTVNKTIIMLRFYEGMTLDEINRVMNENTNTIKTRLYATLKKLRLKMEDMG